MRVLPNDDRARSKVRLATAVVPSVSPAAVKKRLRGSREPPSGSTSVLPGVCVAVGRHCWSWLPLLLLAITPGLPGEIGVDCYRDREVVRDSSLPS